MRTVFRTRDMPHPDLKLYLCGSRQCEPGDIYGPGIRDHYLIHYIHEGKGTFKMKGQVYELKKGQGFLITPDTVAQHYPDRHHPWRYSWIGFNGSSAGFYLMHANLTEDQPIFTYQTEQRLNDVLSEMMIAGNLRMDKELRLISLLYSFLSLLIESAAIRPPRDYFGSTKDYYIKAAVDYIRMNYSRNIRIEDIANYLGINRSYLGSIFQDYYRIPTSKYLLHFRMDKACELMRNPELSIGDIARSVGYEDALLFSKMFKKVKSSSPRTYRKQLPAIEKTSNHASQR